MQFENIVKFNRLSIAASKNNKYQITNELCVKALDRFLLLLSMAAWSRSAPAPLQYTSREHSVFLSYASECSGTKCGCSRGAKSGLGGLHKLRVRSRGQNLPLFICVPWVVANKAEEL